MLSITDCSQGRDFSPKKLCEDHSEKYRRRRMIHKTDSQIVWELIGEIRMCMLVTRDGKEGQLRARPMSADVDADQEAIYFLTDVRHHKDNEIEADHNVCLAFADSSSLQYVSVTGIATVSNDRDKIAELWSVAARVFWDSKDDPNIRVLHVMPLSAEYWDSPGMIVTSIKMAAAALTGTRPNLGANRKVEL
jgi:general stress protein 26